MQKKTKKIIAIVLLSLFLLLGISMAGSFYKIYTDVKTICAAAKKEHGKDCIHSLIAEYKTGHHTEKEKSRIIWAVGQLAEPEALTFLNSIEEAYRCAGKEKYESMVCYEARKAIKWCTRAKTLTKWMYRNREKW